MATARVNCVNGLSEECFNEDCTVCIGKQLIKKADYYCHDCKKNLCEGCVNVHDDFLRDHTVVKGHGDDKMATLLTKKCVKHPEKIIELYCRDHDLVACSICGLLQHRGCEDLKHIEECVGDLCKSSQLKNVTYMLKSSLTTVDEIIGLLDKQIKQLILDERSILDEVEAITKELLAKIGDMKRKTKKDVTEMRHQLVSLSKESRQAGVNLKTEIKKCIEDLKAPVGRKAHLFVVKKSGLSVVKEVNILCHDAKSLMNSHIFFKPDTRLTSCLKGFKTLGRLSSSRKYHCSLVRKVNVELPSDRRQCNILGCCTLPNGTIVMTDYNNKKLKCLDLSTHSVTHHCYTYKGTKGIACIGQQEVAVCAFDAGVQAFTVGAKLTCTKFIRVKEVYDDFVFKNGYLYAARSSEVAIYKSNGTRVKRIYLNDIGLSCVDSLALSKKGDRLYITSRLDGIVCIDMTGQEVFRHSCSDLGLQSAHGMATDQTGSVFICGEDSQNVVQMTEDGSVVGEILFTDGILGPKCLCYDGARSRLFVGGRSSKLLVYKLS